MARGLEPLVDARLRVAAQDPGDFKGDLRGGRVSVTKQP